MTARPIDIPAIKAAAARAFGVSVGAIDSYRRSAAVARARQVAMWLTRKYTAHVALSAIGTAFGRDHSTVLHALVLVDRLQRSDRDFADRVETIRRHVEAGTLPPAQAQAAPPPPKRRPSREGCDAAAGPPIGKDGEAIRFRAAAVSGADALLARLRARYPAGAP